MGRAGIASAGLRLPSFNNGSLVFPFPVGRKGTPVGVMASIVSTSPIRPDPVLRIGNSGPAVTAPLAPTTLPVFDSPAANLQGRVIFVGYGIVDPTQGIDDYAGVDVTNRIVLFLRGKPEHYPTSRQPCRQSATRARTWSPGLSDRHGADPPSLRSPTRCHGKAQRILWTAPSWTSHPRRLDQHGSRQSDLLTGPDGVKR